MFWEGQQLQLEWISKEKLVQLWLIDRLQEMWLEVLSATSAGVFSSVVNLFLDLLAESVDSEESTQPKYPCKISSRDDVSVPAKAIFI